MRLALLASTFGSYTLLLLLISLLSSVQVVEAVVVCPPTTSYTPCKCIESPANYISINCFGLGLNDSRMREILTSFLTTPGVNSVAYLYLQSNKLTYVPREIKFFTQATDVELYNNNISSIESGVFNFSGPLPLSRLELSTIQLTTIAPGAFKGFFKKFVVCFNFLLFIA